MAARLFGTPDEVMPATLDDFRAYMQRMLDGPTISAGETAREIAASVMHPPLPLPLRPAMEMANLITAGLMPPRLRREYGLSWDPVRAALVGASRETTRRVADAAAAGPGADGSALDIVRRREGLRRERHGHAGGAGRGRGAAQARSRASRARRAGGGRAHGLGLGLRAGRAGRRRGRRRAGNRLLLDRHRRLDRGQQGGGHPGRAVRRCRDRARRAHLERRQRAGAQPAHHLGAAPGGDPRRLVRDRPQRRSGGPRQHGARRRARRRAVAATDGGRHARHRRDPRGGRAARARAADRRRHPARAPGARAARRGRAARVRADRRGALEHHLSGHARGGPVRPAPPAASAAAAVGPRRAARVAHPRRDQGDARPLPAHAARLRRRVRDRSAVLRDGVRRGNRDHERDPAAARHSGGAAPDGLRPRRRARGGARRRLARMRPGGVRQADRLPRAPGEALHRAVGVQQDPRAAARAGDARLARRQHAGLAARPRSCTATTGSATRWSPTIHRRA